MYNKIRIEREELYKSVWSTPLTKLAKKYNLPYLELKKVCTKLSIPLPEKNYWINKSLGKTNKITPLHEISENELSFYEIDLDDPKIMIKRNREDLSKSIAVPLTLTNPHPLIKKAKEHWTNPPKEYSHDSLRINVSKDLRHRALLILDTILKHLETKGYWFTFPAFSSATVAVNIDDIKIEIQLHEHSKRIEKIQESIFDYKYKYEYDGNLQLFFHGYYYDKKIQRNFSDGKTKKIEDKIPLFISNLEYAFQID